jgi:hypothetical protein
VRNSTGMDNTGKFRRDRDGEIFENDLTEEDDASPAERDDASHTEITDPDTDSQAADEFMHDRKFPPPKP